MDHMTFLDEVSSSISLVILLLPSIFYKFNSYNFFFTRNDISTTIL